MTIKDIQYGLRLETPEERRGLPKPSDLEEQHAWQLLPNTPLDQRAALKYGALMFALGRRQTSLEWEGWFNRYEKELKGIDVNAYMEHWK